MQNKLLILQLFMKLNSTTKFFLKKIRNLVVLAMPEQKLELLIACVTAYITN